MMYALVTGASGGIGLELAELLARDGHGLILAARSEGKLAEAAERFRQQYGVPVKVLAVDLAKPGAAEAVFAELSAEGLSVEILVNNAGFATYGRFAETDYAEETAEMQLNMVALTQLTKLLLPGMLSRRKGRVLNVASIAAFEPGPLMAVYFATKAYVLSLSEALAYELRGTGVKVTALCPGPTKTGFTERARLEKSKLAQNFVYSAKDVAKAGYEGMKKGKPVVIPGLKNRLLVGSVRFAPRSWVPAIVHSMQKEK